MNRMMYYTLPLTGHQFKGDVPSMSALMFRFFTWCRKIKIGKNQASLLWFYGSMGSYNLTSIGSTIVPKHEMEVLFKRISRKLPESKEIVDLSEF